MAIFGVNAASQPGQPSPLGRLIGLAGGVGAGAAGLGSLLTDPAMLQIKVLEAAQRLLSGAGMPAIFTGSPTATRDRMLLEFLTKTGQMGRVAASMANPREYLVLLENALRTAGRGTPVNPVALMSRVQPVMQESPEGFRTALLGAGGGAQIMQVIRALAQSAGGSALLPLLALPRTVLEQVVPQALGVGG